MTERERNQKQSLSEVRVFPVPFALGEIKENITVTTNSYNTLTKEQIINEAYKLHSKGNITEAAKYYQYFHAQGFKDPHVFNNYGTILESLGNLKEAEIFTRKAIELKPDFADAYFNLGTTLIAIGDLKEAELSTRKAIELNPDLFQAHSNLGNILKDLGKLEEAELSTRKAIEIKPNYAKPYSNLGNILKDLGNLQEAEKYYRKAIELKPDLAEAQFNLSIILLKGKQYKEGFNKFEWRWKVENVGLGNRLETNKPEWEPKKNGTVLLWAEQGLGDMVLYSSLIPELVKKVDKLIFMTDKRLIPLFKRSFVKNITYIDKKYFVEEEVYDYQIPMGSLPNIYRSSIESFKEVPQKLLKADESKTKIYRKKLMANNHKKVIGISWKTINKIWAKGAINLEELLSVIYSSNIRFVNLQYGDVQEEIYNAKLKYGFEIFEIEELDNFYDIDGLAALINACDEIITIDNITAQLGGALGVNTKLILHTNSHWPHGVEDKQSCWFPSIKYFRQIKRDDWSKPLIEIKNDIKI